MRGLIKRDLTLIKRRFQPIQMLVFLCMTVPLSLMPRFIPMAVGIVIPYFLSIYLSSLYSYDSAVKWDLYAVSLPLSRRTIIGSRYLLVFMITIMSLLFVCVAEGITRLCGIVSVGFFISISMTLYFSLTYNLIQIPIILHFNAEAGKIMMLIIILIPTLAVSVMILFKMSISWDFLNSGLFLFFYSVSQILFAALSYLLSLRIYRNKQFS